jgi:hypothetical protein
VSLFHWYKSSRALQSAGVEKVSSNVVDNLPLLASSVGEPISVTSIK